MFGRKPTRPQDLIFGKNASQVTDIATTPDYVTEIKVHLAEVYKHIVANLFKLHSYAKTIQQEHQLPKLLQGI